MAIFDPEARNYDAWYSTPMGRFVDQLQTELAFDLLEWKPRMKLLEVGSGTGNFTEKLAKRGAEVTGIDLSAAMLAVAEEKLTPQELPITLKVMNAEKLDFSDETFDAVFSMVAFEFIEHVPKAVDELFRVVKKGGQIVIGTIAGDSPWSKLYHSETFQDTVYQHAHFHSLTAIKQWHPEQLVTIKEGLFIPPTAPEEDFNFKKEQQLKNKTQGGFLCAKWIK